MSAEQEQKINIDIGVESRYLEEHSDPAQGHHAFAYTITIHNLCPFAVQLLERHWVIRDEEEHITQEVHGEGVVGQQPVIKSGDSFRYTSGVMLNGAGGSMSGSYQMRDDEGNVFKAPIPSFYLSPPHLLN